MDIIRQILIGLPHKYCPDMQKHKDSQSISLDINSSGDNTTIEQACAYNETLAYRDNNMANLINVEFCLPIVPKVCFIERKVAKKKLKARFKRSKYTCDYKIFFSSKLQALSYYYNTWHYYHSSYWEHLIVIDSAPSERVKYITTISLFKFLKTSMSKLINLYDYINSSDYLVYIDVAYLDSDIKQCIINDLQRETNNRLYSSYNICSIQDDTFNNTYLMCSLPSNSFVDNNLATNYEEQTNKFLANLLAYIAIELNIIPEYNLATFIEQAPNYLSEELIDNVLSSLGVDLMRYKLSPRKR